MWHVLCLLIWFAVGEAVGPTTLLSSTSISIAKEAVVRSISESSISKCVRLCDAHMALYICNNIPCDIPDIRTYASVRIDP